MSATTAWNGKWAAKRTMVQYSDMAEANTMTSALATTDREVRVPVHSGERRVARGSWVKTPEGLRLRWAAGN
jgi:hypothetical protein